MPSAPVLAGLLAAGALCIVAGLWMLLRPAARAAAGPLLLLVGAGLMLLPWLPARLPPPPAAPPPAPLALGPGTLAISADGRRTVAAPPSKPAPPLPGREAVRIDIEATEAEPNDSLAAANAARLGTAITGALTAGDLDYFAVDVPAGSRGDLVTSLLVLEGDAGLTIFDDAGRPLGSADTSQQISVRSTMLERSLGGPRYYVLVRASPAGATASYQLTIAARRR